MRKITIFIYLLLFVSPGFAQTGNLLISFNNQNEIIINTPVGSDVAVQLSDSVTIIFDSVELAGESTLSFVSAGPPLPIGFNAIPFYSPGYYKMFTSAAYTGEIEIRISYDDGGFFGDETALTLQYFKDGGWKNIGHYVDTVSNQIGGPAGSLSSFVIGFSDIICGDASSDENVNISDAVWIINYIFAGGDAPMPLLVGDVDCGGSVNISDAVSIINYVFLGGDEPCPECLGQPERIYLTDLTGFQWDVTHAVYQYGLSVDSFNFGLGPYYFTPVIDPDFLEPGDSGYPDDLEYFFVIGADIENDSRAYRISDLIDNIETVNDVYPFGAILVGY